eukprot:RCo036455
MGPFLFLRAAAAAALPLALLLSLSVLPATALPWRAEAIPDPTKDPVGCGRPAGSKSWICDPDHLLSPAGADAVELALQDIHTNVTRKCGDTHQGYEVAVGIVQRMDTEEQNIPDATKRFAQRLHNRWGVGSSECDNGVVMFLSVGDRWAYISTGKGARETLSDSAAEDVISEMRPLLRSGNLDKAVLVGVKSIRAHLRRGFLHWLLHGFFASVWMVLTDPFPPICAVVAGVALGLFCVEVRDRSQRARFRRRLT